MGTAQCKFDNLSDADRHTDRQTDRQTDNSASTKYLVETQFYKLRVERVPHACLDAERFPTPLVGKDARRPGLTY